MNILILDDQPGLALMLAMSLKFYGFSATGLTSPKEALKYIQEYDFLVTDYHMSEMTGLEFARQAFSQGWRGELILMSGDPKLRQKAMESPLMRSFLLKPFSAQSLAEALAAAERTRNQ